MADKTDKEDLVPIPDEAYTNNYDGRVYIKNTDIEGENRTIIGWRDPESGMMRPNAAYEEYFEADYQQYFPHRKVYPKVLHIGLYMIFLAIAYKLGLYQALCTAFGVRSANAIMDFAIYSIVSHSNIAEKFEDTMREQMLFSDMLYNDKRYSEFFSSMTESAIQDFKCQWLNACENLGIQSCWVCVDGSNCDCDMKKSKLSEHGHPKSRDQSSNIIGYTYAVCGEGEYRKLPITYFVSPGGMTDSKSFEEVINFFGKDNLILKGFILDRGYPTAPVFSHIKDGHYDFVVMLKNNLDAYQEAVAQCCDMLWNVKYCISENGDKLGKACKITQLRGDNEMSYASVFQDIDNGSDCATTLIAKYYKEFNRLQDALRNKKPVSVEKSLAKYIQIDYSGKCPSVVVNYDLLNEDAFEKGISVIATSCFMTPKDCDATYNLRDVSEKQFSVMKTQLGNKVLRAHSDQHAEARLAVCFVASILRSQFEVACSKHKLPTNVAIDKLDQIRIKMSNSKSYYPIFNIYGPLKRVLGEFGIKETDLSFFATLANNRMKTEKQMVLEAERRAGSKGKRIRLEEIKPWYHMPPYISHAVTDNDTKDMNGAQSESQGDLQSATQSHSKKRGRPKGSKNRKTLEKMRQEAVDPNGGKPKRGRGRPKGSKNQKTLEREAAAKAEAAETEIDEVTETNVADSISSNQISDGNDLPRDDVGDATNYEKAMPQRGRGRPKGSKNKPKSPENSETPVKRGRGRPAGSKNKKTLEREAAAAAFRYRADRGFPRQDRYRRRGIRRLRH